MKNLKELPIEYQEDIKKAVKILKENTLVRVEHILWDAKIF